MSILIKASYENNHGEIQIRRLSIPRNGLNFELLKQCIAETFFISQPNLKYQDDEGDKITLYSDIELEEALRQLDESEAQILKIFVTESASQILPLTTPQSQELPPVKVQSTDTTTTPKESVPVEPEYKYESPQIQQEEKEEPKQEESEQEEQEVQEEFHRYPVDDDLIVHGIYCDACGFPIIGIRWKCSICPETNYCESCEQIVNHMEEHPLLRIKVPLPFTPQRTSHVQSDNTLPSSTPYTNATSKGAANSTVWGEFQKVLTQPQVVKATNAAKRISSDVTQMITNVSDQIITQTKEVSIDLGEKVSQNTSKLIEMCQNLTISPEPKPTTAPVNDLDCPYKRELAVLEEMGFKGRAYNGFLLNKHKGNLQSTLAELLA